MTPDKSIEHTIECTLDEQQCQQECKHKTDRANCPLVKVYPRELFDGIIRISKQSTAPDKETPDWMFTDIRRGAKFGYKLGISKSIESEKAKDERINLLEEFIKELIQDPYPEDIFLPISKEELLSIHQMLEAKFNMPLDRLSGHIGRLLRNPLREKAKKLLKNK